MNGSDLVAKVAQKTGLTRRRARAVVDSAFAEITVSLATGERVTLSGFGTFDVRPVGAREGRHPRTGEKLMLPSRRVVVFRVGRELRDAIEESTSS